MNNQTDQTGAVKKRQPVFGFSDGIRTLLLVAFAGIVSLFEPTLEPTRIEWTLMIAAICLLIIAAQFLRAWQLSRRRSVSHLHELFLYQIIGLVLGASCLYLDLVGPLSEFIDLRLGGSPGASLDWLAMLVAGSLFLLSFTPLTFAFVMIERRQKAENKNKTRILRDDIVSVPSLVITVLVLSLIFALAWAAGSGRFELGQQINILTIIVVVGGFLAIIFIPNMVRAWNDWTERQATRMGGVISNGVTALPLSALSMTARGVSYFDSILVRIFAPLSGATQSGFMVAHLLVLLVIIPLSAMGFILAAPFGLIPISLAALIALALGRRWAWVEDDRETASRLQSTSPDKADIKVGFENDLKDEALLGYASLFVLVPLALYQIQGALGVFESTSASTGNPFVDWLSFFGAELAKAVPFVDWWEIYNVDVQVPFEASTGAGGEWARHMTFAARAIVDLVIMAALFQAITIWQRSRMQRRLFGTGELNAFDPFTEEEFFERGMHKPHGADTLEPKNAFKRVVEEHVQARRRLNLEPLPYSRERLGELIKRDDPDDLSRSSQQQSDRYMTMGKGFERMAEHCCDTILREIESDTLIYLRILLTREWFGPRAKPCCGTIIETTRDYWTTELTHLKKPLLAYTFYTWHKRILAHYLRNFFSRNTPIKFDNPTERRSFAEQLRHESLMLEKEFKSWDATSPDNAAEYHFSILSNIADVIAQTDADSIVLEIATLAKKYPSLNMNQVTQILLLRGDLTKQEAKDRADAALANMPRVNQGILFEVMEIVNQIN